jgi:hypothetical protein
MDKKLILLLLIYVYQTGDLYAQWTKEDSVWLDGVLSGKETIKLRPEFQQAIESDDLIHTGVASPARQLIVAPGGVSVSKDFTEYLRPAKIPKSPEDAGDVDPYSMPPAVFMRYGPDIPLQRPGNAAFTVPGSIGENAPTPSGRSFDDALKSIFSPSFRAKERNRKNANAWKRYHLY